MPTQTKPFVDLARYLNPEASPAVGEWALDVKTGFVGKVGETRSLGQPIDDEDDERDVVTDFYCSMDGAEKDCPITGAIPPDRLTPITGDMTFFRARIVYDGGSSHETIHSFRLVADSHAQAAIIADEAIYMIHGGGTWTMTSSRESGVTADPDAFETLRSAPPAPGPCP